MTDSLRKLAFFAPSTESKYLTNGPATNVCLHLQGVMQENKEFYDVYSDLLLIQNQPDYVIADIPFRTTSVFYTIWAEEASTRIYHHSLNAAGSATRIRMVRMRWDPLKHTEELMKTIYREDNLTWGPDDEAAWRKHTEVSVLLELHPDSHLLRLHALHPEISALCCAKDEDINGCFPVAKVLELSPMKIRFAAELLSADPFRLYFHAAHGLLLPDMENEELDLSIPQYQARNFYQLLMRATFNDCHSFIDCTTKVTDEALTWLIDNGVVSRNKAEPTHISLIEIAEQEDAIIQAIHIIEESGCYNVETVARLTSGKEPCDEQQSALFQLQTKPILAIDGRAGSGKTDFIGCICASFKHERVFCTAFQGVNAGALSQLGCNVSTTHRLLNDHAQFHSFHPKTPCMLRQIEVLVVDEVCTQSLELFAHLLSAFATCGPSKKKLVMVGDLGQLGPIGGPAPFRSLIPYFIRMDYLKIFVHNHRAVGKVIADNANLIRDTYQYNGITWNSDFLFVPIDHTETPQNTLCRVLKTYGIREDDFIVVTHRREDARTLSVKIEQHYGDTGSPGVQIGHKFCFKRNCYEIGAINNEVLKLIKIEDRPISAAPCKKKLILKRKANHAITSTSERRISNSERYLIVQDVHENMREIIYDVKRHGHLEKASAVTSNAMQGSSRKIVIRVDFDDSPYSTNVRIYTDVTRAISQFIYIGQMNWFRNAVSREEYVRLSDLSKIIMKQ